MLDALLDSRKCPFPCKAGLLLFVQSSYFREAGALSWVPLSLPSRISPPYGALQLVNPDVADRSAVPLVPKVPDVLVFSPLT